MYKARLFLTLQITSVNPIKNAVTLNTFSFAYNEVRARVLQCNEMIIICILICTIIIFIKLPNISFKKRELLLIIILKLIIINFCLWGVWWVVGLLGGIFLY